MRRSLFGSPAPGATRSLTRHESVLRLMFMTNNRFNGFLPRPLCRRFGKWLGVAVLHAGAWYVLQGGPPIYTPTRSPALAPREIIVRLYTSPSRHSDHMEGRVARTHTGGITIAPLPKKDDRQERRPPVAQSDKGAVADKETTRAISPGGAAITPAMPEGASPIMDSEKVKKVIADMVAEEHGTDIASRTTLTARGNAAEKAIGQAIRPKCEDDRAAKAGNVQFTGLMKLPSLMLGAMSDKGCKW